MMVLPLLLLLVLPKLISTADPETQKVGQTQLMLERQMLRMAYENKNSINYHLPYIFPHML